LLLENKNAVIYGGGGAIGGAAARAFAREGARVFLAGRTSAKLEAVAKKIGDAAEIAVVDALDENAVREHADSVAAAAGRIDIALNVVGVMHVQGVPFEQLSLEDFMHPIDSFLRTNFITANATARHMTKQGSGVILTISTVGSRLVMPGFLGYGTTCSAVEAMSARLAAELGPSSVRVICLQPDAIPEAAANGSYSREVFQPMAEQAGVSLEQMLEQAAEERTLLKRLPTLAQVADTAAFLASDRAAAITGAVTNLSCGSVTD
jgi:3-oxoacyl-[acyl-carrier protein] reductase